MLTSLWAAHVGHWAKYAFKLRLRHPAEIECVAQTQKGLTDAVLYPFICVTRS